MVFLRFVKQFTGQSLAFGKVIKQIKCQVVEFTSDESGSKEVYLDNGFKVQKLPYSGLEGDSNADVVEEEGFLSSGEEPDDLEEEVDETEVEEDVRNHISSSIESPPVELRRDLKTELKFEKEVVKREIREHEELETPLVSFQANKSVEAAAETRLDDDDEQSEEAVAETFLDDEFDGDDVEDVSEENLEPLNSSLSSSEENRVDRIRRLEQKLLGKEKLLGGGVGFDKPEAKPARVEGKKKEKKKKKILVKGQAKKSSKIEIPGSSKR